MSEATSVQVTETNKTEQSWTKGRSQSHPKDLPSGFASPFLNSTERIHETLNLEHTKYSTWESQQDDITVVTMYLDIGTFRKGTWGAVFTPDRYKSWMRPFGQIQNPVIGFFDNASHAEFFLDIRGNYTNSTKIILLENRKDLWAFQIMKRIKEIFESPGYPKIPPATTVPEYSSAMHAKYEVMLWAVQQNIFNTRYFAWADVGLFKDLKSSEPFHMYPPSDFDPKRVAYTKVNERKTLRNLENVLHRSRLWVCGGCFLGNPSALTQWSWQYRATIEAMLKDNIMASDQEVRNGNLCKHLCKVNE